MNDMETKSKSKYNDWAAKDWERHSRVLALLQVNRMTVTDLSHHIDEPISNVSACIWGIPSRKNPRIEGKIANFLGVAKEELFGGMSESA